jgi:hypothetical protein
MTVDVTWYVLIQSDLQTTTVNEEIRHYSSQYSVCLNTHQNNLAVNLMAK